MFQALKDELNAINNEMSDLDARIDVATTDRELNEIGSQVMPIEEKLGALSEALELAEGLPQKLEKLRNKLRL